MSTSFQIDEERRRRLSRLYQQQLCEDPNSAQNLALVLAAQSDLGGLNDLALDSDLGKAIIGSLSLNPEGELRKIKLASNQESDGALFFQVLTAGTPPSRWA